MKLDAALRDGANLARAIERWTPAPPDWIAALARACDAAKSQKKVAERLGISSAMVNQAIGNAYAGNLANLEQRVRGELMAATVACPVLGDISTRDCLDHHSRKFAATNPQRRMLARACPGCPHNTKARDQ